MVFDGVLPIDKPFGLTSHDVVARLRRLTGEKRIGHAGTLDPMATGVLLLCLGEATRLSDLLMDGAKAYVARLSLGTTTDTDDALGQVLSESRAVVSLAMLTAALARQVGVLRQTPPAYSAIKSGGVPAYKRARAGNALPLAARDVCVYRIVLLATSPSAGEDGEAARGIATADILVQCAKGTYIRSIAREVGEYLGCGAHLSGLRRIASGAFTVDHCVSLDTLSTAVAERGAGALSSSMRAGYEALASLPIAVLSAGSAARIRNGMHVDAEYTNASPEIGILDGSGRLMALARQTPVTPSVMRLQPAKVFGTHGA